MVGPMKKLVETNAIVMSSGLILHFPYVSVEVSFHKKAQFEKQEKDLETNSLHLIDRLTVM